SLHDALPICHHLVKEEPRVGERQARGQGIADHVHLVAAVGQRHRQLGGHDAGTAVGGVAADADPHRGPPGRSASRSTTASGCGLQKGSPSSAPISWPKCRARPSTARRNSREGPFVAGPPRSPAAPPAGAARSPPAPVAPPPPPPGW